MEDKSTFLAAGARLLRSGLPSFAAALAGAAVYPRLHALGLILAAAAAALAASAAAAALAHSLWLETPEASPPADAPLKINIGFNEGFEVTDVLDEAVPNIEAPIVALEGGEAKTRLAGGRNYEYVTEEPVKAGSYVAYAEYKPFVMGHGEGPKNKYFMTGKHVINAGGASGDFPSRPLGKARLEIVPLANPSGLKAGGSLPVQVLFEGKPLHKATVLGDFRGFNPAGSWGLAKAFYCQTDKDGKADFLPVKGGLWILKVRHAVAGSDDPEAAETVHLANLTFFVGD
ncbi:MAG: DUF4198 domain-containing protein [Deltaproteobacteria bacterium]|jgi:uncharacterized GH25 family protein|nr:DUF4198 domain-containing protein [Deltaproteobacteria bacterium]